MSKDLDPSSGYAASAGRFARYVDDALCDAFVAAGWDPDRAPNGAAPVVLTTSDGESAAEVRSRLGGVADAAPVLVVRPGDRVSARLASVLAAQRLQGARLVLFDLFRRDGDRVIPYFLPGVNYVHALNADYYRSRFLVRAADLLAYLRGAGRFSARDLSLGVLHEIYAARAWAEAAHVALPLIGIDEPAAALSAERARILERAAREPFRYQLAGAAAPPAHPVSVVICTRDRGHLLGNLVRTILEQPKVAEVVIVSNQTSNLYALRTLQELAAVERVKVVRYDQPFNFSAQSNLGARERTAPCLVFMNDDVVPVNKHWLDALLEPFANPRVDIAAPLLLYPDERVQHAGMYLGYKQCAGHVLRFARLPEQDYLFLGSAPRQVACVTGAVLAIRRARFERLDGFDESLRDVLQDVDLCLRAHCAGSEIVFNPRAVLLHAESASVAEGLADLSSGERRGEQHAAFRQRWGARIARDPFHNPNFESSDETLSTLRRSA